MNYLYDGRNVLEEVDNSGNVLARYTEAGMDEGGRPTFLFVFLSYS
jgi:hypothetical protein